MKYVFALALMLMAASAQAQLIAPRGSKATLQVEYLYTADGRSGKRNGNDTIEEWKVRRVVNLTAHYVAEEPTSIGVLHSEPDQQAALQTKTNQAQAFGKKMVPTFSDMMKIAERCGEDEACIEKAVVDYGNRMNLEDVQARKAEATAIFKTDGPRYQLWRQTAQSGTYEVDELTSRQIFEIGCTLAKPCKRTVTRRGKGPIKPPPGGEAGGASLLEIDGVKQDLAAKMPIPLSELLVETKVESNIPDDDFEAPPLHPVQLMKNVQTLTLAIEGGKLPATGTATVKQPGTGAEGGTYTIKWTFKRQ